jgi:hypothetical protein
VARLGEKEATEMPIFDGNSSVGVVGRSTINIGVHGLSQSGEGVLGRSTSSVGVNGISSSSTGVWGLSGGGIGVHGNTSARGVGGVVGQTSNADGSGVQGVGPDSAEGVLGRSETGAGVRGISGAQRDGRARGFGVHAIGREGSTALFAEAVRDHAIEQGFAGEFNGDVRVGGTLTKAGGGFSIDHPLDPANKYFNHSFVESSEMKNFYDGIVTLDEDGTAWADLPEWFETLNGDFRYQLTAVGGAAPNLHVAEEIYENNRFKIAGGEGGMKVCWQVTGTRKDPWAAANPFVVEEDKPQEERGRYLQPALYGAPEEQSVLRIRVEEERLQRMGREEPPSYEPPKSPEMPPGVAAPGVGLMGEENRRQIDELRGQIEELRRGRLEEEIDELRRQVKKLRRRRKR